MLRGPFFFKLALPEVKGQQLDKFGPGGTATWGQGDHRSNTYHSLLFRPGLRSKIYSQEAGY